jgi:hypothetical protein
MKCFIVTYLTENRCILEDSSCGCTIDVVAHCPLR